MLQTPTTRTGGPTTDEEPAPVVRHLRQALLWPLRLLHGPGDGEGAASGTAASAAGSAAGGAAAIDDGHSLRRPWRLLQAAADSPWREQFDEYTGGADGFHERHYNEFVTFLPYVQRFLYGQGRRQREGDAASAGSPMRVFRRHDIAAVRVTVGEGDRPLRLSVVHVDLYFFSGVDVVLLNVEVAADELPLAQAQELMYRLGRAYPSGWDSSGRPLHGLAAVEWLDAQGQVLAASDAHQREAYLAHVGEHRAPRIAAHWEFMLLPLAHHHSARGGALRYQQIEYYRMPMMAYVSVDDPRSLSREDFIRLGLVTGQREAGAGAGAGAGAAGAMPYAEAHLADFEAQFCYDRFWLSGGAAPNTRYLCSGLSLVVVGAAQSEFFGCRDRGVLAQFRHQHFLLFLIAHFQKATLLMYSDRLAEALTALDIAKPASVKRFKRHIRGHYASFLSFTHGYWFAEVSEQAHVKALFQMCRRHLHIEPLYQEVKQRIHDMNGYLDADSLRRQANTVVRLTVVTIFGLIGTVTTGFLGMNLLAEADASVGRKLWLFAAVFVPTITLTIYTMAKSKRLSDFLDVLSDERLSAWTKVRAFAGVWRSGES